MLETFGFSAPSLAPTERAIVASDGCARLLRFFGRAAPSAGPILLVPSIINRWYVLDLRRGASLVEALVEAGFDVYCLDWGVPEDEDRYLSWDDLLARLARMARAARRASGAPELGVLGYCMGATLAAIHAALEPRTVRALVNLLGPIDFSHAGKLRHAVDPRWFDLDAVVEAGNVSAEQMQAGFVALRPTAQLAKWVGFLDRAADPSAREAFLALEAWASDNIPFPAAAYRTYIQALYRDNALVAGTHRVAGRRVELANIECPTLTIVAERDEICPPPAATALAERARGPSEILRVPGGHVGAVIGSRAREELYPRLAAWLSQHLVAPQHLEAPRARTHRPERR